MPQKFQPARLRTLGDDIPESMGEYISESLGAFVGIGNMSGYAAFKPSLSASEKRSVAWSAARRTTSCSMSCARRACPTQKRPLSTTRTLVRAALGIKHSKFWELVKQGKLETRKLGSATIVPAASLQAFIDSLPASNGTAA